MNNAFMFMPQMNPFADNARFIKKSLSKKTVLICIVSMSILLVTMIFGAACFFNLNTIKSVIETQSEEEINVIFSTSEGLFQILCSIIMFLPFLAFIILYVRLRSDEFELSAAPFIILRLFLIVTVISSVSGVFSFITSFASLSNVTSKINIQKFITPLIFNTIPSIFAFAWSLVGLLFCSSVIATIRGKKLEARFGKAYMVLSLIYSIIIFAVTIYYYADGFKHGLFESNGLSSVSVKSIIMQSIPIAYVMFALYHICSITVVLSTAQIAKQYIYAVSAALRSFQTSGTNLFMNSDSSAADFYTQSYTAPSDESSAPSPVSSQQFDKVSEDAFQSDTTPSPEIQPEALSIQPPAAEVSDQPSAFSVQNNTYICQKCGKENNIQNKFCSSCGNNRFGT